MPLMILESEKKRNPCLLVLHLSFCRFSILQKGFIWPGDKIIYRQVLLLFLLFQASFSTFLFKFGDCFENRGYIVSWIAKLVCFQMLSPPNLSCVTIYNCLVKEYLFFWSLSFLFLSNYVILKCFLHLQNLLDRRGRKESSGQLFWIFIFWHPHSTVLKFLKNHFSKVTLVVMKKILGKNRRSSCIVIQQYNIIELWRKEGRKTAGQK